VLRVNERRLPAELLRFGDHVQRHGRLAAGLWAVNLDHAPARKTRRPAPRQRETSAGDYAYGHQNVPAAQAHDRTLTVVLFNLRYRCCSNFSFRLSCHTSVEEVKTWACGPMAWVLRGKAHRPVQRHNEVWSLPLDSSSRHPFFLASAPDLDVLSPPPKLSVIPSVARTAPSPRDLGAENSLSFVAGRAREQFEHHQDYRWQPCSRRGPRAASEPACSRLIQRCPFGRGQSPQPDRLRPGCEPRRAPLRVSHVPDSLDIVQKTAHGAPVENGEEQSTSGEQKAMIFFAFSSLMNLALERTSNYSISQISAIVIRQPASAIIARSVPIGNVSFRA